MDSKTVILCRLIIAKIQTKAATMCSRSVVNVPTHILNAVSMLRNFRRKLIITLTLIECGHVEDPQKLKKIEERSISRLGDNPTPKVWRCTKDTVVKSLESLGVKPQRIVKLRGCLCDTTDQ